MLPLLGKAVQENQQSLNLFNTFIEYKEAAYFSDLKTLNK